VRPGRVIITVTGIRPNSVRRLMPLRGRNPSSSFATDEPPMNAQLVTHGLGVPATPRAVATTTGRRAACAASHGRLRGGASGVQSLRGVARGIKTARGGTWTAVQVSDILRRA
jgi:hypothetical protein